MDEREQRRIQREAGVYRQTVFRYLPLFCVYVELRSTFVQAYTIDDGKGGEAHVNVRIIDW